MWIVCITLNGLCMAFELFTHISDRVVERVWTWTGWLHNIVSWKSYCRTIIVCIYCLMVNRWSWIIPYICSGSWYCYGCQLGMLLVNWFSIIYMLLNDLVIIDACPVKLNHYHWVSTKGCLAEDHRRGEIGICCLKFLAKTSCPGSMFWMFWSVLMR